MGLLWFLSVAFNLIKRGVSMNYDTSPKFEELVEVVANCLDIEINEIRRGVAGVGLLVFVLVMEGKFNLTIGELSTVGLDLYHDCMDEFIQKGFEEGAELCGK